MVVAHFFESGQRRRLRWGRVESAPLMAGAVALAAQGNSCDRRKGWRATSLGRRPGFPQREPALPRDSSRAEYARRKSSHPFERGWIAAQLRPPDSCSPANGTPESLDDGSSLRVINSFTAPVLL